MKIILLILGMLVCISGINAQYKVKMSSEPTEDGYDLYAENISQASYTVVVEFDILQNYTVVGGEPMIATVVPGRRKIGSVKRIQPEQSGNMSYKYRYYLGCSNTKVDTEVVYLLPVADGNATHFSALSYLNESLGGEKKPDQWNSGMFTMTKGDTVFAMRRGRVVEVEESHASDSTRNFSFHRDVNQVLIEQEDCTLARYSVLAQNQVFVSEGEMVEAGQPLAIVGGSGFSSGYHVRIMVSFLNREVLTNPEVSQPAYYTMKFVTREGGEGLLRSNSSYTSVHPSEIIFQEMSKRQIKTYLKNKETND
jgi:hypothetical protein